MKTNSSTGRAATRIPPLRRTPSQFLRRYRRPLMAILVFVAVFAALRAVAPNGGGTYETLAPVRDLPAGHVVTDSDVTTVSLSGKANPHETTDSAVLGRTLTVSWPQGVPLHRRAFAGADVARHLPDGQVAVGLQPGRGSPVGFIRPGDRVDVILGVGEAEDTARPETIAEDLRVLSVSGSKDDEAWAAGEGNEDVIVVSAPRSKAADISDAPRRGMISLVVSG